MWLVALKVFNLWPFYVGNIISQSLDVRLSTSDYGYFIAKLVFENSFDVREYKERGLVIPVFLVISRNSLHWRFFEAQTRRKRELLYLNLKEIRAKIQWPCSQTNDFMS